MNERRVCPHPEVILTELSDGTGVLLHLNTKFFFTLNETAVLVWKVLSMGASSTELARAIVEHFDVDLAAAERDARALLDSLAAEQLIVDVG